ncbi:MAG: type II toxin-antitoxin system death-on-curing family toxin [Micrococcales bacterium]|nr:type II toxin-antitoxin system death-on-curing family toxin [Micrococcales bacterium]MCL2668656.1 type II toxin-antitoxin system death-on-curing family toxin [Micrococcales bacterium]
MTEYLDLDDLLAVAHGLLDEPLVRDYGLLESALARPRTTVFGEEPYPTLDEKAAALLLSLVGNHSLVDGNKRLGWVATAVFYELNGYDLRMDTDDAVDLVMSVASGGVRDVEAVAVVLAQHRTPLASDT